jgi:hypothetical protein
MQKQNLSPLYRIKIKLIGKLVTKIFLSLKSELPLSSGSRVSNLIKLQKYGIEVLIKFTFTEEAPLCQLWCREGGTLARNESLENDILNNIRMGWT